MDAAIVIDDRSQGERYFSHATSLGRRVHRIDDVDCNGRVRKNSRGCAAIELRLPLMFVAPPPGLEFEDTHRAVGAANETVDGASNDASIREEAERHFMKDIARFVLGP